MKIIWNEKNFSKSKRTNRARKWFQAPMNPERTAPFCDKKKQSPDGISVVFLNKKKRPA